MENIHRLHHYRRRNSGGSSKWIAAVASIWIQCSCGASYAFGIYSPILKSSQGYDQATLDTVSVFKDIGANAGIISGLLYSAVVVSSSSGHRWWWVRRPWVVHLVGAIQCFVGYFMMWASVIGIISRPHVGVMCVFMFLAAHAQTFFNTANVVTAVHNFPDYSGTIVGIMKGFLGLSGAVLIQVYDTLFEGSPSTFLLMLALLPTLISILLMWLVKIDAGYTNYEKRYLNGFSVVSLVVAAYLMILIILENTIALPLWSRIVTFVILLALLSSTLGVAGKAQSDSSLNLSYTSSTTGTPLLDEVDSTKQETMSSQASNSVDFHQGPSDVEVQNKASYEDSLKFGPELNLLEAIRTANFWLLFIAMLCGMGSGLATINNISQIGQSLGYTSVERSTLVSLWSIWNYLGRFGAGYASDIFLHRRGWARPLLMVLTLAAMTGGHVIIASGFPGNLYIGSVLVGVCYGSQWSLMPTITSEIFGVRHLGTIFNSIAAASPVGSYILSVRVIGYIYDRNATGEDNSCYGKYCFMLSFFILASVSLFGFLVALALFFRTRKFYSQLLIRRLRHIAT
ncbi:hypothetical protein ACH5RR_007615 [Cinchona calisaya]|uniref:Major facilitator superfamily (MFS) profile domain-containing protein n=1 Tax=Cinchona calisaya TaxID=153742 RepID=A0ABD3AAT8_9GENT